MPYFQTIYSGSSGNCSAVVCCGKTVLIDMGKSCRAALTALEKAGIPADSVAAVLITHEHSDHVSGLDTFLKHRRVPVFGPEASLRFLSDNLMVPQTAMLEPITPEKQVGVCALGVTPFRTAHDSADCFGYTIEFPNGQRLTLATDIGHMTEEVLAHFEGSEIAAIEANYDEGMLRLGRYPLFLKKRILSENGHLSNCDCADTVARLAEGTPRFSLMHLSQENNTPDMALTTVLGIMENRGARAEVLVAPRHEPGRKLEIG